MGTQIGNLLTKSPVSYGELSGKVIAIDAYNTIYQFLSAIRQSDGSMLTDSSGNPVSHLTGLFLRTGRLREANIRPVFVFDGRPPEMKKETLEKRQLCRENAVLNYEMAKERGNTEEMKKYAQAGSRITPQILDESKKLLELMGIPWVQAKSEAEAQVSYMVSRGDADFAGSQDYDVFLFGAENVIRNLGSTGKRKVPGQQKYVTKTPEHICLSACLKELELSREQLIDVAICIGTDFNEGMHRVGAKTALKLIRRHGDVNTVIRKEKKDIRGYAPLDEIREFFLNPPVNDSYSFGWKKPFSQALFDYLVNERDFSEKQVVKNIQILEESTASQSCLTDW